MAKEKHVPWSVLVTMFLLGTTMSLPTQSSESPSAEENIQQTTTKATTTTTTIDYDLADFDENTSLGNVTVDTVDLTDLGQGDGSIQDVGTVEETKATNTVIETSSTVATSKASAESQPANVPSDDVVNSQESAGGVSVESQGQSIENKGEGSTAVGGTGETKSGISAESNAQSGEALGSSHQTDGPLPSPRPVSQERSGSSTERKSIESSGNGSGESAVQLENNTSKQTDASAESQGKTSVESIGGSTSGQRQNSREGQGSSQNQGSSMEQPDKSKMEASLETSTEVTNSASMENVQQTPDDFIVNCFDNTASSSSVTSSSVTSCASTDCTVCKLLKDMHNTCGMYYPDSCMGHASELVSSGGQSTTLSPGESADKESEEELTTLYPSSLESRVRQGGLEKMLQTVCSHFCVLNLGDNSLESGGTSAQDGTNVSADMSANSGDGSVVTDTEKDSDGQASLEGEEGGSLGSTESSNSRRQNGNSGSGSFGGMSDGSMGGTSQSWGSNDNKQGYNESSAGNGSVETTSSGETSGGQDSLSSTVVSKSDENETEMDNDNDTEN